ncbi:ANM_collapsed_G0031840.mRNA.1.CDS.1 [Saccharomyces cerevisiae]|nr:ANM_collapsed_G0031840.mRNA.1.CDS.1 [Saccharomyces cerevisiae]
MTHLLCSIKEKRQTKVMNCLFTRFLKLTRINLKKNPLCQQKFDINSAIYTIRAVLQEAPPVVILECHHILMAIGTLARGLHVASSQRIRLTI